MSVIEDRRKTEAESLVRDAAPDMLEALRKIDAILWRTPTSDAITTCLSIAERAITKATEGR